MQIEMTVPIIVNDFVICEFDAAVDIKVTQLWLSSTDLRPARELLSR